MRNKSDQFPSTLKKLAVMSKALAHPARIQILQLLAECNTCITGELVDQLPLAQATVSQHLVELKNAGFIRGEIHGPKTCYCLDYTNIGKAKREFADLFEKIESK